MPHLPSQGLFTWRWGPQIGGVICGGSPHLSCKRDRIKLRDYKDRQVTTPKRVTSPSGGPSHPCKQALIYIPCFLYANVAFTIFVIDLFLSIYIFVTCLQGANLSKFIFSPSVQASEKQDAMSSSVGVVRKRKVPSACDRDLILLQEFNKLSARVLSSLKSLAIGS